MEKNCLVTTYKATVNDNSLLKVGEMFIDIIEQESPTNQTNRLYLNTGNTADLVVEVENGAANITLDENMASGWTNKVTLPKSISAPAPVFVRNGSYRVKVSSKYNLTEVGRFTASITQKAIGVDTKYLKHTSGLENIAACLSGDIANLSGCTKLYKFTNLSKSSNLTGSLSDLAPLTALAYLNLSKSPNLTGSLSDLAPLTALADLDLSSSRNLTGSLSDLAPLTALANLNLSGNNNFTGNIKDISLPLKTINVYATNITGEIIEFVKTQRSAGRTTGSCSTGWWGEKITFNGTVPSASSTTVTWTESTITLGNTTVNQ